MNLEYWIAWGAPQWFWALAVVPVAIVLFFWSERRRSVALSKLVAARLQSELAGSVSLFKRRLHFALMLAALVCFILALAMPRHGFTLEEAKRKGRDVLIAVDTSRSMLSTDVKPNRLERAKLAAQDLIASLQGDRAGLLAFAGSSFLQAPLTVDYTAVLDSLKELDTKIIPLGGTDIAEAIRAAVKAFGKGESESRVLVLFTDGEDLSAEAIEEAKRAAGSMHIFTVGVGSADGSLIPVPNDNGGTEFVKGPDGQFVKSHLDEKTLTAIAEATGGFYTHLQNSPVEMRRLVDAGLGKLKEGDIDSRLAKRPIERYQWPLGFGIVLLIGSVLVNERRRNSGLRVGSGAVAGCLAALALMTLPARAAEDGVDLYQKGKFAEARQVFETQLEKQPESPEIHFNKGTADYALRDYRSAINELGKALVTSDAELRGKAEYNLGTALLQRALQDPFDTPTRKADLKNAEQHLAAAEKLLPKMADIKKNLEIAKNPPKPKPTPPPQQQKQDDQKKDDKQDQKDQQSKDQQSKDQQSKDQQSKDQQSKDQQSKDQQSKDQQSKDQQSKDQQSKDQQPKDQQQPQPQGEPSPTPGQGEQKKLSGDIKANDSSKHDEKEEEAAEAQAQPGEMTPSQARAVLDSLKGEDGQPFKIQQRSNAPVLKDW